MHEREYFLTRSADPSCEKADVIAGSGRESESDVIYVFLNFRGVIKTNDRRLIVPYGQADQ